MKILINEILFPLFLFSTIPLMIALPIVFIMGLYYVFSAKKLNHENLELANLRMIKGLKFILFSTIIFMVGFGVCASGTFPFHW